VSLVVGYTSLQVASRAHIVLGLIRRLCFREVVIDTSTVRSTVLAKDLGNRSLQNIISTCRGARGTIGNRIAIRFVFSLGEFRSLCTGLVDVAADLKISLASSSSRCIGLLVRVLVLLAFDYDGIRCRLPGLKSTRRIADYFEMSSEGGSDL
jgi:hypothetical protein